MKIKVKKRDLTFYLSDSKRDAPLKANKNVRWNSLRFLSGTPPLLGGLLGKGGLKTLESARK